MRDDLGDMHIIECDGRETIQEVTEIWLGSQKKTVFGKISYE